MTATPESRSQTTLPKGPGRFALSAQDRKWLWIALGALLVVRLIMLLWLPFTDTTEARYAEIARKMVETGDWITPQFDYGVPFWGKPPLHTWLSAIGMALFGVGPFGARIFILLTGLGVLWLLYDWARVNRGADQALVATVVLASAVLFFVSAGFVMTDMAMVLGTTASMVGFHRAVSGGARARLGAYVFFAGLAVGLLAKGPVAIVLTAMPIGLWVLIGNRWRLLARLPWISGLALTLVLALPWYIAAELKTPGFLRYFIIGEHYERFVVSGWQGDLYGAGHARPKGTIWAFLPLVFLPWTIFALALMARPARLGGVFRGDGDGWYSYLLLWLLAPLILFTPAANILASYVLPGLPAAALLLTALWADMRGAPGRRLRLVVGATLGFMAALYLLISALAFFVPAALGLRSEKELVAKVQSIDPALRLTYWPERSYSGEFYTRGKARNAAGDAALAALSGNGRRDAVAVESAKADTAARLLGPGFEKIGRIGPHTLFVERAAGGGNG